MCNKSHQYYRFHPQPGPLEAGPVEPIPSEGMGTAMNNAARRGELLLRTTPGAGPTVVDRTEGEGGHLSGQA
jgi:hypothetical protein